MKLSTLFTLFFAFVVTAANAQFNRFPHRNAIPQTTINPKTLQIKKVCPDPAIVDVILRPYTNSRGKKYVTINASLKNIGGANFDTNPGQQLIYFYVDGVLKHTVPFGDLAAGQVQYIRYDLPIMYTEFPHQVAKVVIGYDPDIYQDGNPKNDDCNQGNNKFSVNF